LETAAAAGEGVGRLVERPYEALSLAELVEQAEFQYDDGLVTFELLSELVRRAEAAEHQ
jgi:hypothetical protein